MQSMQRMPMERMPAVAAARARILAPRQSLLMLSIRECRVTRVGHTQGPKLCERRSRNFPAVSAKPPTVQLRVINQKGLNVPSTR
jgi:hypothetical protein